MNHRALAAALFLSFLASAAAAAEAQRRHYVACPRGMEGTCGDIPGVIGGAVGGGEIICDEARFSARKAHVNQWLLKVRGVKTSIQQIEGAITGLGGQYASQGKRPPLAETADFVHNDLLARLLDPIARDLERFGPCYQQNRRSSDGCHHLACGDPEAVMRNIEALGPSILRIEADLDSKRRELTDGLQTSILVGSGPQRYDKCLPPLGPQHPCQQLMTRSLNAISQAVRAVAETVGELSD